MGRLGQLEMKIYDDGHRLIPGVTHDEADQALHVARYEFCKRVIQEDMATRHNPSCITPAIRVLDVGCGVGYGTSILASIPGVWVLGIDVSEESIQYAQIHYGRLNIEYQVQDITQFADEMSCADWDYIVANEIIEHIENGFTLLERLTLARLLIFSTPYDEPKGVNPHHLLWNITEQSFSNVGPKELFFTDLQGIIYDRSHQPERPINLIAIIYTPEARNAVRKVRIQIWLERTLEEIRIFLSEKWKRFKSLVHPFIVFTRSIMNR